MKPGYYQGWYSRGNVLVALQRYPEALDSFNKAIHLQPDEYKSWENRGWVLHQLHRYPEAITSYDRAIQLN
ncbi:MAG: tetratricopeptide repeat protein [Chroococcidiopsidaceae cyanobacterium CP_BM_RX_35]|nr:tetratricopeptide repeat protein [Chroococcidiopsidaceae cyanobacterium CP_BM_RX_35]